jgi:hypothetical protein
MVKGMSRPPASDPARFELWDAELGLLLGRFASEAEALAAVRRLCETSAGSRAPLGLIERQRTILATGDALVDRAFSRLD